jgi:hypothetical protein
MEPTKEQSEQRNEAGQDETLREQRATWHHFMRECRACQQELAPHSQVCAHCGARLETHCPGCGSPLPPAGAQACPWCGLAIPQAVL